MSHFHCTTKYYTYNHLFSKRAEALNTQSLSKTVIRSPGVSSSEYRLYDSIKHVGLLQPLVLVMNCETHYHELFSGGRTRLKLLDIVQQKRKKRGLEPVPVRVVSRDDPVHSQEINLSHLIQNHVHRHCKFIDKAIHILDCIDTREKEIACKMSQREAVNWLRQNGFPISQSLLNDMKFVVTELYPLLPRAISNGLGRRNIVRIRTLHRAMREVWNSFGDNLDDCQEAFQEICEECDGNTIDFEQFRAIMEREVCLWCSLNSQFVRAVLQVNRDERTRLIDSCRATDRNDEPKPRSTSTLPQQIGKNHTRGRSVCRTVEKVYDLLPVVLNRRKRFARRLALDLAKHANLLNCVSGSVTNSFGYQVLYPPRRNHATIYSIWQFLYFCKQSVESTATNNQRLHSDWHSLHRREFLKVCLLVEVARTFCFARREPNTAAYPQLTT